MTMVVIDFERQYPVLPPIPRAKKSLFQRLKDAYNRRKKKTLNGRHRWFEIFRRKKRNDPEAHANLMERELESESVYLDVPEDQEDRPDPIEMTALAKKKVKHTHVTTGGLGFKSKTSEVSGDGDVKTKDLKLPLGRSKGRNNVISVKPPVPPRKSAKFVCRSSVPDTTTVTRDNKDGSGEQEQRTSNVQETKQLPECEKPAMEVSMPSVKPVKRWNGLRPSQNTDPVLDGLEKLMDDVEFYRETLAATKPCPPKNDYTDDILDGLEELMDDVYYDG